MIEQPGESQQHPMPPCPGCGGIEECDCPEDGDDVDEDSDDGYCECYICESERRSDEDTVRTNAAFQDGGLIDRTGE